MIRGPQCASGVNSFDETLPAPSSTHQSPSKCSTQLNHDFRTASPSSKLRKFPSNSLPFCPAFRRPPPQQQTITTHRNTLRCKAPSLSSHSPKRHRTRLFDSPSIFHRPIKTQPLTPNRIPRSLSHKKDDAPTSRHSKKNQRLRTSLVLPHETSLLATSSPSTTVSPLPHDDYSR